MRYIRRITNIALIFTLLIIFCPNPAYSLRLEPGEEDDTLPRVEDTMERLASGHGVKEYLNEDDSSATFTVVVVDDRKALRIDYKDKLEAKGYKVIVFEDAISAINFLKESKEPIACFLLDYDIHHKTHSMKGPILAKSIREKGFKNTPIVIHTDNLERMDNFCKVIKNERLYVFSKLEEAGLREVDKIFDNFQASQPQPIPNKDVGDKKKPLASGHSISTENALLSNKLLDTPAIVDSLQEPDNIFSEIDKELIKEHGIYYGSQLSAFLARHIPVREDDRVLDFGTGGGIIAIYLNKKGIKNIVAIDNDRRCIDLARRNLEKFNLESIIKLIESDAYSQIDKNEKFNTIVFAGLPVPIEEEEDLEFVRDNTQIRDSGGRIIKLFLSGTRNRLLKGGKVVLMYVDDPASIERIIDLGLDNDLIITKRIKFRPYSKKTENELTEGGIRHWSVFIFERLEDLRLESDIDTILGSTIKTQTDI